MGHLCKYVSEHFTRSKYVLEHEICSNYISEYNTRSHSNNYNHNKNYNDCFTNLHNQVIDSVIQFDYR